VRFGANIAIQAVLWGTVVWLLSGFVAFNLAAAGGTVGYALCWAILNAGGDPD
jgi:hypothetical protein